MKVTLYQNHKIEEQNQYGSCSFASFRRIIETMQSCGELRKDANVIGVQISEHGLQFFFKD